MSIRNHDAELVISAHGARDFVRDDRPQVAVLGRSNVGKSSLLNRILGLRKLARVSSTPGRTQAINYFLVDRRFYVVDLPGYGWARVSRQARESWAKLIDAYLRHEPGPSLVVQLVDAKVGATALDVDAARYLADLGHPARVVATKVDKVGQGARHRQLAAIREALALPPELAPLPFSSTTGEGREELWGEIEHAIGAAREHASTLR